MKKLRLILIAKRIQSSNNYKLSSRINEKRLDSVIEKLKNKKSFTKDLAVE